MFRIETIHNDRKVYSNLAIKKDTVICKFEGKPIDYKDTLALGNKESFALQVARDLYIYLEPPARYFNHCCEPNCGVTPNLELIALKDIDKNEELRWDYSTTMLEHHWTMKCTCGKPQCRKVISDFDKLPKKLQLRYLELNIVQPFIKEIINLNKS